MFSFTRCEVQPIGTNCYILKDEKTGKGLVIDPGGSAEKIIKIIDDKKIDVEYILLTHIHYDHLMALGEIKAKTNAKICVHSLGFNSLTDSAKTLSRFAGGGENHTEADISLNDNDNIDMGETKIKVIHTPGHTTCSVCYLIDNSLFCGDTLFYENVGRCDLPGGNFEQIKKSIKTKLYCLDGSIKIYPGHGESSTIGHEKQYNEFVRDEF